MSVLTGNILTRNTTDLMGFGVVLNPDGSVASISGATMEYVTAAPTATRNGGSLALRSNGALYATAGGGVWVLIGGAASGWLLPDNVPGIWGTTAPLQVTSVYTSASTRWDMTSGNVSQAAAAGTSVSLSFATGSSTVTGAAVGGPSGNITWATGATDSTNAGGTSGASGSFIWTTGNASATLGTSGNTGGYQWTTGNSTSGNSGSMVWTIGSAGGTQGTLQMVGRLTTTDGVTAGTARVVGGRAFASVADSTPINQAGAGYVAFDISYSIPQNTLKAGSMLRIRAVVRISTVLNAAATAQARIRLGGTQLITTLASTGSAAGTRATLEAWVTARTAPGGIVECSGTGTGIWTDTPGSISSFPTANAVPTFATNGALVVDVAAQTSAAGDGSGRLVLEQLIVEII